MATRTRKGHISETLGSRGPYYRAVICVNSRYFAKCSYDRAEVEAWLADMLAAHPVAEWDNARKHAVRPRLRPRPLMVSETPSLWMVAAETNPMTAHYHIRVRGDWRRPEKVLGYDLISEAPFSWIADDNGGEGYGSEEEARLASLAVERDPCVSLAVRPLARRWRGGGNAHNGQTERPWQGE